MAKIIYEWPGQKWAGRPVFFAPERGTTNPAWSTGSVQHRPAVDAHTQYAIPARQENADAQACEENATLVL